MIRLPPLRTMAAALLLTVGCAAEGPFPSLLPREAERATAEEPEQPVREAPSEAGVGSSVAELLALARQGDNAFEAAHARASEAVRGGGAVGSDSWVAAQEVISRAEAARADTTRALVELDQLALARAGRPTNPADLAAIQAAVAEAERIAAGQQVRIDRLRGAVSGR